MNNSQNINKSYAFALRVVKLYPYLCERKEYVLSKQALRSGTAVGAWVSGAEFGQSKADFITKLSISLKEANETLYWLSLLKDGKYVNEKMFIDMKLDNEECIKFLISSIKTAKNNSKNHNNRSSK